MSKKKGLSFEEKRKKMMEIFYESREIYLLKGKDSFIIILLFNYCWEKVIKIIFSPIEKLEQLVKQLLGFST